MHYIMTLAMHVQVTEAFEVLSDPARRAEYDSRGRRRSGAGA